MVASRLARVVFAVFCALFVLSVAVQYNDPDPWLWVLVYAAAALICGTAAAGKRVGGLAPAVAVVAALWMASLAPSLWSFLRSNKEPVNFTMKTGDTEEEEAREAGGLALVVVACAAVAVFERRRRV